MLEPSQARVWKHLQVLCEEIGPRLSGTAGDDRATEYISEHMRRCGLETEVQEYPCPAWEHGEPQLTMLKEGRRVPLPAVAQTFSEACDVEAQIACAGSLKELDLAPELDGKVLVLHGQLASSLTADRNPALLAAEERRAAALIVVSPAETVSTKLTRDPFARAPSVAVPRSAGGVLLASQGSRITLRLEARRYESIGHNVIGRVPGDPEEHVLVAAHYDTAADVPGAVDNASGTAVLLELCERFAASPRQKQGLHFVAYGAEEYGRTGHGCLGAVEYVRRHPGDVEGARAVVEIDCVGTAAVPPAVTLMDFPRALREELLGVLTGFPRCGVQLRPETQTSGTPFSLTGLPTVWFVNAYPKIPIHTAHDSIDLLSPEEMAYTVEAASAVLEQLVSAARDGSS
ncbi:M28 family metallopeptidase [bacterium]|nr:M28 family metallopeptidase [bacterium]